MYTVHPFPAAHRRSHLGIASLLELSLAGDAAMQTEPQVA